MPNILFASNNLAHWPTARATSQANTFDDNRVPYALMLEKHEILNSPSFPPSTTDDTWIHFRLYPQDSDYGATPTLCQAYDPSGNLLFRVRKANSTYSHNIRAYLYDGSTNVDMTGNIPFTNTKVNSIDIHHSINALGITLQVYVNSSLAIDLTLNSNPNALTPPSRFSIGHGFGDADSNMPVSEILVADGDTRNARLDLLRPTAAGAYEQWLGSLAVLADDDTTTGMTTIAGGQRQTVTLTPYTGASNISNLVAISSTTRGQNSPTGIQHTIRLSTVDYDGPVIPVDFSLQYNITDWQLNPATSLPWVGSDLDLIETGFVSVA